MSRRGIFTLCLVASAGLALGLRVPGLSARPMHLDEAVQAVKTGILMETGEYRYDPHQYHGPTLYYFALAPAWLVSGGTFEGTTEGVYRGVVAAFGVGLVLLVALLSDGLGRGQVLAAAVLTAISPAFVFYTRFYMQEPLLVFFTAGAVAAGWRYARTRRWRWAVAAGVCLGLMHATKETCLIAYAAMAIALAATVAWARWRDRQPLALRAHVRPAAVVAGVAAAVGVSTLFFTSFFTHARGPLDSLLTYVHCFHRAAADPLHLHPWHYYLGMILRFRYGNGPVWSEAAIVVLAGLGFAAACRPSLAPHSNRHLLRFLAVYTLAMTAVYSAIPYKTPWCMLSFLHGMILLAGVGATVLATALPTRPLRAGACALLLLAGLHLGWQAYRASFPYCADPRNPYVYAQTGRDLLRLAERVEDLARVHPKGRDMVIKVIAEPSDYWPLPWYLRRFKNVGYWQQPPQDADAAVVITSTAAAPKVAGRFSDSYQPEHYGLRPDVLLVVHIESGLWQRFLRRAE